jgi:hypothetical protein
MLGLYLVALGIAVAHRLVPYASRSVLCAPLNRILIEEESWIRTGVLLVVRKPAAETRLRFRIVANDGVERCRWELEVAGGDVISACDVDGGESG